ncbi:MAG TPA: DUF1643 domain-containing protein [Burkholderiaceae bacterium]|nr:DUF1643 domain-containing protein [Burkholderiaceae bacterium]
MEGDAALSPCGTYRYALWRKWASGPQVLFVMLNPSTANATQDDPTIRRCIGFARSWGFGSLAVGNLFAFRCTDPSQLQTARDPVGPENDRWLKRLRNEASLCVAAWGNEGSRSGRSITARALIEPTHALGLTTFGAPRHPLYVRATTQAVKWL